MDTFYGWRPVPCRPQRTRRTGEIFSEPGRYTSPDGDPADEQPTETYSHGLSLFAAPSLTGSGSPVVGSTPTGTPLFAASLETPKSPLTDSDYMMLLGSSKLPNSLVPQHLERWLRKALRDNQAAYEQWKRIARGQGPATEALHTARTIEDACTVLLSWPETLMDMLHAVPYVPVVFARIPGFLHQLGYELLILGRTAHLREIINDSSTPAAAVQLASPWLAAIEATVSRSDCWRLANSATRWGRLKKKMKNASALPRSLARVSDTEWGELLAHMMVHHSSLPPTLRVQPVATRCKHLLCRTVTPANADTVRAGVSVHQRWLDLPFGTVPGTSSGVHAAVCTVALASPGGGDGRLPQLKALRCLSRQIRESLAAPPVASTSRALRGTAADQWRARIDGDRMDVVFLQETKATRNWAETLEQRYARGWGLRAEQVETPLSWWTSTKRASGGVAVLFHPDSPLRQLTPCLPELWGPHCLALHGQVDGCKLTLVCIYAPVDRAAREALFSALSRLRPTGTSQFNCSLDASLDRSHPTGDAHDSPRLAHLLHRWSMVDSAISDMLEAAATGSETDFHARAHSYWYRLPDGQRASSRLDRWYIIDADYNSVLSTMVTPPCSHSDHDAVLLRVGLPAQSTRVRSHSRRSIRYPPPRYAQEVVAAVSSAYLAEVSALTDLDPQVSAMQWDVLKDEFRVQLLRAVRASARKLRGSYRQRLRRLRAALRAERARDTHPRARGSLVQRFELLTVDSAARQESLRAAIVSTQELYAANRRIRKFEQYTGHNSDATRALFRRINMKYAGRKSSRARAPAGHVDARTLSRDWQPILQQDSPTRLDRETFFARLAPPRPSTLQLDCTAFTASEVASAIASCPRGKACGPDGLPNDSYRDYDDALAPILAALLSGWMRARVLPPSFASAAVCCIPKISTPRSGLDYRPIALLNSDYKIYSRLLLNRVKDSLASVLAPTQFGFVPGRQVHDAIDVWSAVQRLVHERRLPDTTTAVLLDFAKAYDTLDRTFLSLALAHHGFPRDLIAAIEDMHLATTARFLSRGELSDDVAIHNGIRQGCPLAPVLFVPELVTRLTCSRAQASISSSNRQSLR